MPQTADFRIETTPDGTTAVLTGDWTAVNLDRASERLADALAAHPGARVDMRQVGRCDTSGAYGVLRAAGWSADGHSVVATPEVDTLLKMVIAATGARTPPAPARPPLADLFERIGRGVFDIGDTLFDSMVFTGQLVLAIGRALANPAKVRWAAAFALAERAGLDALPIVATTTFFIGAVVGLVGANMLRQFGAQVFVVELVGVAVMREFNVLITAVLLAGRSASSFAAEIGSMKMNQEIDAMLVLGVDPYDALVLPRFLALLFTIPLLVFVATIAGLAGGLLVTTTELGISPTVFYQRMIDNVGVTHFWVGMSKGPVMAVVIAAIGCRQGMEVGGDVESLGRRVTAAVVQAIFAAILLDALFALIFMRLKV